MAIISILPNGSTSGNPNYQGNKSPSKRKDAQGWNFQVSRRLRKWLYSIPTESLTGYGIAFTLTVRDCPETSDDWADLRNNFIKRMFRNNCVRLQWLTEWQARGVPHLHGIAYFDSWYSPDSIISHWKKVATKKYGSDSKGQNAKEITSILGWLDYLAKHSTRSADHYQRSPENVPEGWVKTGRMWGYRGDWDIREPMRFQIEQSGFYAYRRIISNLRWSQARERACLSRSASQLFSRVRPHVIDQSILPSDLSGSSLLADLMEYDGLVAKEKQTRLSATHSKRGLKNTDIDTSHLQGTSIWINRDQATKIILFLGQAGYRFHQE